MEYLDPEWLFSDGWYAEQWRLLADDPKQLGDCDELAEPFAAYVRAQGRLSSRIILYDERYEPPDARAERNPNAVWDPRGFAIVGALLRMRPLLPADTVLTELSASASLATATPTTLEQLQQLTESLLPIMVDVFGDTATVHAELWDTGDRKAWAPPNWKPGAHAYAHRHWTKHQVLSSCGLEELGYPAVAQTVAAAVPVTLFAIRPAGVQWRNLRMDVRDTVSWYAPSYARNSLDGVPGCVSFLLHDGHDFPLAGFLPLTTTQAAPLVAAAVSRMSTRYDVYHGGDYFHGETVLEPGELQLEQICLNAAPDPRAAVRDLCEEWPPL